MYGKKIDHSLKALTLIRLFYERKWIVLSVCMITMVLFIGKWFITPPVFKTTTKIQYIQVTDTDKLYQFVRNIMKPEIFTSTIDTQISLITSERVIEKSLKKLNIIKEDMTRHDVVAIIDDFKKDIGVRNLYRTNIIELTVHSPEPDLAMRLANTIAQVYKEEDITIKQRKDKSMRKFILEEIEIVENKQMRLKKDLKKLSVLRKMDEEIKRWEEKKRENLNKVHEAIIKVKLEKNSIKRRFKKTHPKLKELNSIEVLLESILKEYSSEGIHTEKMGFDSEEQGSKISKSRINKANMIFFSDRYQKWLDVENNLRMINAEIVKQNEKLRQAKEKLHKTMGKSIDSDFINKEISNAKETYLQLKKKLSQVELSLADIGENVVIWKEATLPEKPTSPKFSAYFFGGIIAGLILSMGIIFLVSILDDSMKTVEEVEIFTDHHVLGVVPYINHSIDKRKFAISLKEADTIEMSPLKESSRIILSAIHRNMKKNGFKTLLITSTMEEEGKSTICTLLGIASSEMGKKTLIIDMDFRKSRLPEKFGIDNKVGISNMAETNKSWEDLQRATDYHGLYILPSGQCNIIDVFRILGDGAFSNILEEARQAFDLIILDTPPITSVADTYIIGSVVDAGVIIYAAGVSTKRGLYRATNLLKESDTKILGLVFNNKRPEKFPLKKYYQHYYSYNKYKDNTSWYSRKNRGKS